MRLVFCGSPPESVVSLRAAALAGHEIALVVTRPDRPQGRGRAVAAPPVKTAALELGLEVFQPEDVNHPETIAALRRASPDLLVVVAFGAILRDELLGLAPRGALNVHFSLLPAYRGACPVEWAILDGRTETGVTTMFMAAEVDAGDVILTRRAAIGPEETAGELRARLAEVGARALVETLAAIASGGEVPRSRQDPALRSRAPRLKDEMARLDWNASAFALHNRIRALNPEPGAVALLGGEVVKVWRSRMVDLPAASAPPGEPGEITGFLEGAPLVACGEGSLLLTELQAPGKRALPGAEFARGRRLRAGERLGRVGAP